MFRSVTLLKDVHCSVKPWIKGSFPTSEDDVQEFFLLLCVNFFVRKGKTETVRVMQNSNKIYERKSHMPVKK